MTVATDLDQLAIDTIRTLSIDAVQKANSGHPGAPMGAAPMAYVRVDAVPAPRADAPRLARSRPVRAERRPRQHAALLAPPPDRLRGLARGPPVVPAVGQHHARPPRVRPDTGRRGHHRPARPGLRQRRRDGHRRTTPGATSSTAPVTRSSITGPTSSPPTATSRRASPPRRPAWPATCAWASSSSSTTTTGSSSTGRRRWPSPRTSPSASTPTAGTPSGSPTATTSPPSRRPSRPRWPTRARA